MNFKVAALLVMCIVVISAVGYVEIGGLSSAKNSRDLTFAGAPVAIINSHAEYSEESGAGVNSPQVILSSSDNSGGTGTALPIPEPTSINSGGTGTDTKIISTAEVTIEVNNVTGSVETLRTLAIQKGGYVSSTDIETDSNNQPTGTVVLRIPAAGFDTTLNGIKAIGTVKSVATEAQDVTENYVDVQAQITSYQNQIAQYNTILKQSQTVADVLKVQEQIDQAQTELDRLNVQMKYLNSQIDFSTITVNLQEPEPVGSQGSHDFVAAINEGIAGFLGMIDTIIIVVFSIIPLVIIGGAGYCIYRVWKWNKKPQAETDDKK
jgi:hypothetical protein